MNEVLSIIAFGLAAFLAAIMLVLCIALILHWGHKREKGLMPYIFYPIFTILALDILLSGRNLWLQTELLEIEIPKHPLVVWAGRASSLFILFAACERIARRLLYSGYKPDAPILLIVIFSGFFLTSTISSAFLSAHPSFSHEYFYTFVAGCASLLCCQLEADTIVRSARNTLFIFLVISAATAMLRPEMVLSTYKGLIPGLDFRYAGLNTHANTFGPIAAVFLLCLWSTPFFTRWANFFGWTLGIVSLVLTQSKTSWIAFLLSAFCICYVRYADFLVKWLFDFRRPNAPAVFLLMLILAASILGFYFIFGKGGESILSFFTTDEGSKLLSLTGRDQIWEVAVQEWRNNPLFGYGLTIWDEDHRAKIGIPSAVSAHSQFYQTLSSAGIVGVAGLVIYVITLFRFSLITSKASRGLSIALFMVIFLRSASETPLIMESLGPEVIPHLLLLMVIASNFATRSIKSSLHAIPQSYQSFIAPRGLG
jgi:exopolysaccharide production protein ExoQ